VRFAGYFATRQRANCLRLPRPRTGSTSVRSWRVSAHPRSPQGAIWRSGLILPSERTPTAPVAEQVKLVLLHVVFPERLRQPDTQIPENFNSPRGARSTPPRRDQLQKSPGGKTLRRDLPVVTLRLIRTASAIPVEGPFTHHRLNLKVKELIPVYRLSLQSPRLLSPGTPSHVGTVFSNHHPTCVL
jgi:hypothetical protein